MSRPSLFGGIEAAGGAERAIDCGARVVTPDD